MTANEGIGLLEGMARKKQVTIPLYIGIATGRIRCTGRVGRVLPTLFAPWISALPCTYW